VELAPDEQRGTLLVLWSVALLATANGRGEAIEMYLHLRGKVELLPYSRPTGYFDPPPSSYGDNVRAVSEKGCEEDIC